MNAEAAGRKAMRPMAFILAGLMFLTAAYRVTASVALADEGKSNVKLEVGQVWSFDGGKPGEELIIGRIETLHGETVVSISLSNIVVPDAVVSAFGGQSVIQVSHMPFVEEALLNSIETLIRSNAPVPEGFEEGYQTWKQAMENEGAGFFTVPVSEGRNFILSTVAG